MFGIHTLNANFRIMSAEARRAFLVFKSACIEVSQKKDKHSVENLNTLLKKSSEESVQELHEYLLFPLRVILIQKQKPKEDVIIATVNCLGFVLSKVSLNEWNLFRDIFNILVELITTAENGRILPYGSEHLKLSVIKAMSNLINVSSSRVWMKLYQTNSVPFVGHIVSICLSIIDNEKNRTLKKAAIFFIECLCMPSYLELVAEKNVLIVVMGNFMLAFLPGILSSLAKVASGDITQGQALKCVAISVITKLLKLSVGDQEIELANDPKILKLIDSVSVEERLLSFKVQRDEKWVKEVTFKLDVIISHMLSASDHTDDRVKMTLLNFSHVVLMHCCRNALKGSIGRLLKIPVKLLHGSNENVSKQSRQQIEDFSLLLHKHNDVTDVLENQLFDLCSTLPSIIAKTSDDAKLSNLHLLLGYIDVLKLKLPAIFCSTAHLSNLLEAILICFEINCSNVHNIEEVLPETEDFDSAISSFFYGQCKHWIFRKSFVHFHNDQICQVLRKICKILGTHGEFDVILEFLLTKYQSKIHCTEVVLVINEILLGFSLKLKNNLICDQIDSLLDVFTAPENWYLCTSSEFVHLSGHRTKRLHSELNYSELSVKSSPDMRSINSNIVLTCLHLEAISTFSSILGESFRDKLLKTLYPVLEKMNDSNHLVSSCALNALKVISSSCNYDAIAHLINDNADYLVSTISIHLRHLDLFPRSPAVLQAMLSHSDVTVFPLVRDTIDEILTTMDHHHLDNQRLLTFLPVLLSIVKAINTWFKRHQSKEVLVESIREAKKDKQVIQEIKECLDAYQKTLNVANLKLEDEEVLTDNFQGNDYTEAEESLISDETKKDIPAQITVVIEILKHVCYLMSNKNPKIRLMAMEVVNQGIQQVSEDENVLLPLVHKLWSPVMARCADPELQVVSKAFDIICYMGEFSEAFMRRRFTKDMLPRLLDFLKEHATPPVAGSVKAIHSHFTSFKLQRTLLNKLGPLLLHSQVSFNDIEATSIACLAYLNKHLPKELQDAALSLFTHLIKIDPDYLWLFLSDVYTDRVVVKPKSSNLREISVSGTTDKQSPFAENISYLLTLC